MAKIVVTALDLEMPDATDISSEITAANLEFTAEMKDTTDFESAGWRERISGLKEFTLNFTMQIDASNANWNAMWTNFLAGTAMTFDAQVDGGSAASTANPSVTGSVIPNTHSVGGSIGEVHTVSFAFPSTGAPTFVVA